MPEDVFGMKYQFMPKKQILSFEEIFRIANLSARLGVGKIRLTGGEPLLRADVEKLVALLSEIPGIADLTLTTNGYFLEKKAVALKKAGLRRLTISLDTLDAELFKKLAGNHLELNQVFCGIKTAQDAGFAPIKINSVIQKGLNENEIINLLYFALKNNLIVRFIEYMDVGNLNGWKLDEVFTAKEILAVIAKEFSVKPIEKNYNGEVAERYTLADVGAEFGIIASVSQPFCRACTRARLSADGQIYTCLFSAGGVDLKTEMRNGATDDDLLNKLRTIWQSRTDRYSEERSRNSSKEKNPKVEMYHIGG
jgi:cyclic pyranopterin phosphate synthase